MFLDICIPSFVDELTKIAESQLDKGVKTEAEHDDTVDLIKKNPDMPKKKIFKHIAKDHLKESKTYYDDLAKMEGKEKAAFEIQPEDRPDIPKKDFAQPNKEEAGHKGKYPIPDRQHAKSALGFAKMHGDSKALQAVKAKIKKKFPDMDVEGEDKKEKTSCL